MIAGNTMYAAAGVAQKDGGPDADVESRNANQARPGVKKGGQHLVRLCS